MVWVERVPKWLGLGLLQGAKTIRFVAPPARLLLVDHPTNAVVKNHNCHPMNWRYEPNSKVLILDWFSGC